MDVDGSGAINQSELYAAILLLHLKINKVVKMMEEGFYIDHQASRLSVKALIYNGDERVFGFASFGFTFRQTGPLTIDPVFTTFSTSSLSTKIEMRVGCQSTA